MTNEITFTTHESHDCEKIIKLYSRGALAQKDGIFINARFIAKFLPVFSLEQI